MRAAGHLEEARVALAADDYATALDALVAEWQRTRSPAIAELVDALDSKVGAAAPATEAEWLEACHAQKPRTFRSLMPRLMKGLSPACTTRMKAMKDTQDPRLAKVLLDIVRAPPFRNAKTRPFWKLLFEGLQSLGDVRVIEPLTALEATYDEVMGNETGPYIRSNARETIAALSKVKQTKPDAKALTVLQGLLRGGLDDVSRSKVRPDFAPLYAAVWNAPDDDAPRAVLADALTEAGDARGVFITEQLATGTRRATSSDPFVNTLLGRLSTTVVHATFERGFPVDGWLWLKKLSWLQSATGLPEWSTFKHLHLAVRPPAERWQLALLSLLTSPAMKSLEALTVRGDESEWLDAVLARCSTLTLSTRPDASALRRFEQWKHARPGRTLIVAAT